ncbi:MAG: glycosyltransferase family 4 protein [Planctomycetota bacterium]
MEPAKRSGKVLHLIHSLEIGGLERVTLDLAQRSRRAGLEHEILLLDHPCRGPEIDYDPGDVPVRLMGRKDGFDMALVRRLRAEFRAADGVAVNAQNATPIFYAAMASRRLGADRPTLVGTFHTVPHYGGWLARNMTRWATGRMKHVLAVSEDLTQRVVQAGWSVPTRTLLNGVDTEKFAPRSEARRDGPMRVAMLARFFDGKRQDELIEAARRLARVGGPIEVTMAGQGPHWQALHDQALKVPGCRVIPPVHDVAGLLRDHDVFTLCSDHEGMPMSIIEGMACGLACVASAVGGIPALLGEGEHAAGLLFPAGDVQALTDVLGRLAADPVLRERLGQLARERARRFSFEEQWKSYCRLWYGE